MSFGRSSGTRDKRLDLGENTLIKITVKGHKFELIVNAELVWKYCELDEDIPLTEMVEGMVIFTNAKRGQKASEDELEMFELNDELQIIEFILRNGQLNITAAQRNSFMVEKMSEIIEFLHLHCINPRTNLPHPPERINNAINEAGIIIKWDIPADEQAVDMIPLLQPIIPIRMEVVKIEFRIPATLVGPIYGKVTSVGTKLSEEWLSDGTWVVIMSIPAGAQAELIEEINSESQGKAQIKILERSA
ncbi:MAG: ribosome assembly factor SBDS [Candidatus Kariarchaeaceae archaeon]